MKRFLTILLSAATILSLSACGSTDSTVLEDASDISADEDAQDETGTAEDISADSAAEIKEGDMDTGLLFYSDDNITVSVTNIALDEDGDIILTVEGENTSEEGTLISVTFARINRLEHHTTQLLDVEAGETNSLEIALEYEGYFTSVSEITQVGLGLQIVPDDYTWIVKGTYDAYIDGEENAASYEKEESDEDILLLDDDNFIVTAVSAEYDDYYSPEINLTMYIEAEDSFDYSTIGTGDIVINDQEVSTSDGIIDKSFIYGGDKLYVILSIDCEDYNISSIDDLENISFHLTFNGYTYTDEEQDLVDTEFSYQEDFFIEY